jgi:serine/threonine protein kinase
VIARKELKDYGEGGNERHILDLLQTLQHPNIVEFLGSYAQNDIHHLLFAHADMNLSEFLRQKSPVQPWKIYAGMYGVADALSVIHNFTFRDGSIDVHKIGYHHDLRPDNILVKNGVFIITDFGLSKIKSDDKTSKSRLKGGDYDYLGPESFNESTATNGMVGRALDVWALGCIFSELASLIGSLDVEDFYLAREETHGFFIDHAFHLNGQVRPIVKEWLSKLANQQQDRQLGSLVEIVSQMLNPNPYMRIKMDSIVPRLSLFASESRMDAIDHLFQEQADSNILISLEAKRFIAWRSMYEQLSKDTRLQSIQDCLKRLSDVQNILPPGTSGSESDADIRGICAAIDSVCSILPPREQDRLQDVWSAKVCEEDDVKILETIRSAQKPERYRSVGIKAAMKHMSLVISKSIRSGFRPRCIDLGCVDIDRSTSTQTLNIRGLRLVEDRSRIMGHYDGEEGRVRVLIEWKEYDNRWQGKPGSEIFEAMDALVNLLDPNETPREGVTRDRVLGCVGYIHDQSQHRFGFIYKLGQLQQLDGSKSFSLYSLNNVIRITNPSEDDTLTPPDLGTIFGLAKELAFCLYALHSAGWYHKNLSSHSILVFSSSPEELHRQIATAVLGGFNDSRPDASGITLGPKDELKHYYHPLYQTGTDFRRSFDYYSFGLVLLELGSWFPISQLREDHEEIKDAEQFRMKLIQSYVPQLGFKVGARYRDAVQFCLDVEEQTRALGADPQNAQEVQELFRGKVVEPLSLCFA